MFEDSELEGIVLARPLSLSGGLSKRDFPECSNLALMEAEAIGLSERQRENLKEQLLESVPCFTSVNAVRACFENNGLNPDDFVAQPIAAVGERTAEELGFFGLRAEIIPRETNAQALAGMLIAQGVKRVVYFSAEQTKGSLQTELRTSQVALQEFVVYRLVERALTPEDESLLRGIGRGEFIIVFTNGRSVEVFLKRLAELHSSADSLAQEFIKLAVLGSATERVAISLGLKPLFVGDGGDLAELLRRIRAGGSSWKRP